MRPETALEGHRLTADQREALIGRLGQLVTPPDDGEHGTARLDREVERWSRDVQDPGEVLALVAELRRRTAGGRSRRRAELLDHVQLVGVTAVSQRQLKEALTDALTGLATRARLQDEVDQLVSLSARGRTPLTAVVIDIDGLKQINDERGHAAGDEAIAEVGRAIRQHVRRADRAFRIGGDEFALFLSDTSAEGARVVADRIKAGCSTPLSVGIATHRGAADPDVAAWLDRADAELYGSRKLQPERRVRRTLWGRRRFTDYAALALAGAVTATGAFVVPAALHTLVEHGAPGVPATALPPPAVEKRQPAPAPVSRAHGAPVTFTRVVVVRSQPVTAPAPQPSPVAAPVVPPVPVPAIPVVPAPSPSPSDLVTGVVRLVQQLLGR